MITITTDNNSTFAFASVSSASFDSDNFILSIRSDGETFRFSFAYVVNGKVGYSTKFPVVDEIFGNDDSAFGPALKTHDEDSESYMDYVHELLDLPRAIIHNCKNV